ncbi:hypothetical protein [Alteriqipengyuania lutimaris]|uniref:Uncharacterized protein n=1 Tax=Alteriqipengyuania lutimaris TaxID=1538146 RepID=A0A395LMN2_9SPHN|nr:hypothetical protein [Alteriqipengyuania lutimaris]MBB3035291.1 hypothetical protein [Alteriqipengyuania lutimaris]RDS75880.1 hypothetical protein DL238_14475 [Alteriqipengyuania lutimaris]
MGHLSKLSLGAAVAALAVAPVQAAERPQVEAPGGRADYTAPAVLHGASDHAEYRRGWRYRRHHRDRVDAGDVIAGALIIGGIFAIASAASRNDRNDRYDRYDNDYVSNDDFDRAVDSCIKRIERQQRVGSVENVGRTRSGYSVSGTLYNGTDFSCQVSGSGRVLDVDYGMSGVRYQSGGDSYGDPQYSDSTYARARASSYSTPDSYSNTRDDGYVAPDSGAQPAYPGGPLPGEEGYDDYADGEPY